MVASGGATKKKSPVKPPGIDPGTSRLLAQCLNHYVTPSPKNISVIIKNEQSVILISNFRRVLNVVCFLLGDSLESEFYMPTFRNTLFYLHRQVGACRIFYTHLPAYEDGTDRVFQTSAYKIQTPGNHPKESTQQYFISLIHFTERIINQIICVVRIS